MNFYNGKKEAEKKQRQTYQTNHSLTQYFKTIEGYDQQRHRKRERTEAENEDRLHTYSKKKQWKTNKNTRPDRGRQQNMIQCISF